MTKLTINRKPKGIYGTPQKTAQAAQQQNKTTSAHKVMPDNQNTQQKLTGATPRRMTKQQRKNRRRVNRLIELWPELFSPESPKPLKVGIFDDLIQDIAARGISLGQGTLRATLARYVQTPRYYRALVAGGARYDLKGQPCGEVTPLQQTHAGKLLEEMNGNRKK